MVLILYGFVVFLATLLGSFVGLGGGVIIKPVLDVINAHSLTEISFFSSCAVFAMSITSTTRHIIKKTPIKPSIVLLVALGSVGGGLFGNYLFNYALSVSSTPNTVRGIQSAILAVFLVCVIIFVSGNFKTFNVKNPIAILLSGLLLGTAAAFLGIGGGPINVAFLTLMFSFTMRDAAVYSVAVIFFSQCANIISTYIKTGFSGFDMKVLLVIIPVAVIGGFIGSILNRKCNEKAIKVTFTIAVSSVAALSLYNAVMSFI